MGLLDYSSRRRRGMNLHSSDEGQTWEACNVNRARGFCYRFCVRSFTLMLSVALIWSVLWCIMSVSYLSFSHSVRVNNGDHTRLVRTTTGAAVGRGLLLGHPRRQSTGELSHDLAHHGQACLQCLRESKRNKWEKFTTKKLSFELSMNVILRFFGKSNIAFTEHENVWYIQLK